MTTLIPPLFWVDESSLVSSLFCFVKEAVLVWDGELGDEACQCLRFNSRPGVVLNIELAKLDGPLDHSPCCLGLVHRLLNRLVHHYQDGVRLKIRL